MTIQDALVIMAWFGFFVGSAFGYCVAVFTYKRNGGDQQP